MNAEPLSPSRRGGFTLIEAAVCLMLLVMLVSVALPALRLAVLESGRAACRDHLRQIGAGNLAWAQDHNGWLIVDSNWRNADGSPTYTGGSLALHRPLTFVAAELGMEGYVPLPQLWNCPSDRFDISEWIVVRPATSFDVGLGEFWGDGNISYLYVAGYNAQTSPENPATAPMFADESWLREFGPSMAGNLPALDDMDNHGAAFRNVVYLDGHVAGLEGVEAVNNIFAPIVQPQSLMVID